MKQWAPSEAGKEKTKQREIKVQENWDLKDSQRGKDVFSRGLKYQICVLEWHLLLSFVTACPFLLCEQCSRELSEAEVTLGSRRL
jgi:hypothetical protein